MVFCYCSPNRLRQDTYETIKILMPKRIFSIIEVAENTLSCFLLTLFCNYIYWMKNLSCKGVSQLGGHHRNSVWQIQSQGFGSSLVSLVLCYLLSHM